MDMDMKFFRKLPVPKDLKEQFPADERIVVSQNKGIPVLSMHTKATRAFMTAARAFANPRVIPVDLNKEDPCIRQGKIYLSGKECEYEG